MTKTKTKNGIEYGFSFETGILRVWEVSDNPHGVNSEVSCMIAEYNNMNQNAKNILGIVKSNFGSATHDELIGYLDKEKANY